MLLMFLPTRIVMLVLVVVFVSVIADTQHIMRNLDAFWDWIVLLHAAARYTLPELESLVT